MTYRFRLGEPIGTAVRRIASEQFDMAEARLACSEDRAIGVHDARRCLKRLRALLRLIRPALRRSDYQREMQRLSGIARLLAGARDLDVMRHTLTKLEQRPEGLPKNTAKRLRNLFAASRAVRAGHGGDGRRAALTHLKRARGLLAGKAIEGVAFRHLVEGLQRTYDNARKRFRRAHRAPSTESYHAWRKAVQLHWRHVQLLSGGWPEAMSARASEAKELARLLGDDHDYAILLAFARDQGARNITEADLAVLAALCEACQSELRAAAKPRGARLFAESAQNLTTRVHRYWESAVHLAMLAPPPLAQRAMRQPRKRSAARQQRQGDHS